MFAVDYLVNLDDALRDNLPIIPFHHTTPLAKSTTLASPQNHYHPFNSSKPNDSEFQDSANIGSYQTYIEMTPKQKSEILKSSLRREPQQPTPKRRQSFLAAESTENESIIIPNTFLPLSNNYCISQQ